MVTYLISEQCKAIKSNTQSKHNQLDFNLDCSSVTTPNFMKPCPVMNIQVVPITSYGGGAL